MAGVVRAAPAVEITAVVAEAQTVVLAVVEAAAAPVVAEAPTAVEAAAVPVPVAALLPVVAAPAAATAKIPLTLKTASCPNHSAFFPSRLLDGWETTNPDQRLPDPLIPVHWPLSADHSPMPESVLSNLRLSCRAGQLLSKAARFHSL